MNYSLALVFFKQIRCVAWLSIEVIHDGLHLGWWYISSVKTKKNTDFYLNINTFCASFKGWKNKKCFLNATRLAPLIEWHTFSTIELKKELIVSLRTAKELL